MSAEALLQSPAASLVFLYSRMPPYLPVQLRALMATERVNSIDVVHWDGGDSRGNRYVPESIEGVTYHSRSAFDNNGLLALLRHARPAITYVSGWMDRGYLSALRRFKMEALTRVVAGVDDQWHGSFRQLTGSVIVRVLLRGLIDVMWVAGAPQRVYAQHFGYTGERVIPNLLSADVDRFANLQPGLRKRFLFLGRFDSVKGLNVLVDAYTRLPSATQKGWSLELVGDGPLRGKLAEGVASTGITLRPYLQPAELPVLLAHGGVGCFPSQHEQWGVAIHELAAAGFPLLLSDACGAGTEFLIHGHNGFRFPVGDVPRLATAMQAMAEMSETMRSLWGARSRELARRITPELSAASLLSLM